MAGSYRLQIVLQRLPLVRPRLNKRLLNNTHCHGSLGSSRGPGYEAKSLGMRSRPVRGAREVAKMDGVKPRSYPSRVPRLRVFASSRLRAFACAQYCTTTSRSWTPNWRVATTASELSNTIRKPACSLGFHHDSDFVCFSRLQLHFKMSSIAHDSLTDG